MSELTRAIAELQANPPKYSRRATGQVGSRTYKYATLDAIWHATEPWRLQHEIVWICCPTRDAGLPALAYTLELVKTGDTITGMYPLTDAHGQALGADITYARRYAYCAVLGLLADEDTDGRPPGPRQRSRVRIDTEHERLANSIERQQPDDRPAERTRTVDNSPDPWASYFDTRGSIDGRQRSRIMATLGKLPHESRVRKLRSLTGDESINSTNDLSGAQAADVLRQLAGS